MAPWDRQQQPQAPASCDIAGNTSLYQPLGITVLVSVAISAISMGALIMLLVYLRKLMQRLSSLAAKMEAHHQATLDELRRLRAEVTFDDSASQPNHGSSNGLGSLDFSSGGFHPSALPRGASGERQAPSGSQGRLGPAHADPSPNGAPQRCAGPGGAPGAAGLGAVDRRSGHGTQAGSGSESAAVGALPRVPSLGAQSNGGSWLDGYSSGEDLTSEEHLDLTRRTIKRTLSNSSIASVHLALTSPGLKESVSKSDMETLNYMFGDESGGVGC